MMYGHNRRVLLALVFCLAPAGWQCSAGTPATPENHGTPRPQTPAPDATVIKAEAIRFYRQRCEMCHGSNGRGDGITAQSLRPRPRDLSDATWQAEATDAHIAKTIVEGGSAVGRSLMMPAHPDLKDKPTAVQGLVQLVRSFASADKTPPEEAQP